MRREFHVRFCEGGGVRFPSATRLVLLFERKVDAERVFRVLPERFGKYGLTLHPDKTRLVRFRRPDRLDGDDGPETFDLLGFTHHWGLSRWGRWIVKQRTAKDRFGRALRRFRDWCRWNRHQPLEAQHHALSRKLLGHYAYYGITSNFDAISRLWHEVKAAWRKALARRSQQGFSWQKMHRMLLRFPLPRPRIVHRYVT